jgi:hypothetical protein
LHTPALGSASIATDAREVMLRKSKFDDDSPVVGESHPNKKKKKKQ